MLYVTVLKILLRCHWSLYKQEWACVHPTQLWRWQLNKMIFYCVKKKPSTQQSHSNWRLRTKVKKLGVSDSAVCDSLSVNQHNFFCHNISLLSFFPTQDLLKRCRPPLQPWTFSSSLSRTTASKTWSLRLTCMPRSFRSGSAQTKAGVPSRPRKWKRSWALSPPPVCTAVSQCSASGARAFSATKASPWRWVSRVLRRSSSTSTLWLSGHHKEATRAFTRSSPSWTRCSSPSAALSDHHKHRCVRCDRWCFLQASLDIFRCFLSAGNRFFLPLGAPHFNSTATFYYASWIA